MHSLLDVDRPAAVGVELREEVPDLGTALLGLVLEPLEEDGPPLSSERDLGESVLLLLDAANCWRGEEGGEGIDQGAGPDSASTWGGSAVSSGNRCWQNIGRQALHSRRAASMGSSTTVRWPWKARTKVGCHSLERHHSEVKGAFIFILSSGQLLCGFEGVGLQYLQGPFHELPRLFRRIHVK